MNKVSVKEVKKFTLWKVKRIKLKLMRDIMSWRST